CGARRIGPPVPRYLRRGLAVVCYLMPGVMAKLVNFLDKAIRPGSFVVTNTFLFRERQESAACRRGLRGAIALDIWAGRHWTVKDGDDIARSEMQVQEARGDENAGIFFHCATSTFQSRIVTSSRRRGN
uniref:hypothetical protein n=1 Tax=Paraburkholderia sp. XV TaxID=2831520 RepID=UPI001CD653F9